MGGAAAVGSGITATPSFRPEPESTELQISGSPFHSTSAHPAMTNQVISRCRLHCRGQKPCPRANYISVASDQTISRRWHTTNKGAKTMIIAHLSEPLRARPPITRLQFVQYLLCQPLYIMITLMVTEALLAALTTWLMIKAGRAVTNDTFMVSDLMWIFVAQSASYLAGALSWYFAERAGFRAFGRYMLQFARDNRSYTRLLSDKEAREEVEPFLTNTTFINIFNFMYEMEDQLKLLLGLIFNSIVLGVEIDAGLPAAYAATFAILMAIQLSVRRRIADIYLENQ